MSAPDVATGPRPADPHREESELLARIRAGDESACETLYLAYHEPLWKFAYGYVRSRDVAEELVQDVFLTLWRDRAGWDVRASARAWLYAAVRNHALNHLRHERVVTRLTPECTAARSGEYPAAVELTMGAPAPDAHAAVEAQELDDAVSRALGTLPERRRMAMVLRWKHDLSPAEIARALGTTPESVRVLLTRARQELAGLIGKR
ncbi:MAG TPA: sigma-70 family RNA polymerase sigma factor [Gemmatimonadaceae bacterium]|nr:sigma-70 family RNA polymerase sigma factor [Gemmatimonadaceae bacterium]